MSLRPRSRRKPQSRTSVTAYNAALHFLARPKQYRLSDAERADPIQVVEGYTSPYDHGGSARDRADARALPPARAGATVLTRPGEAGWRGANGCGILVPPSGSCDSALREGRKVV
jgi:hypothetical protein